jgi:hypothetical protein
MHIPLLDLACSKLTLHFSAQAKVTLSPSKGDFCGFCSQETARNHPSTGSG